MPPSAHNRREERYEPLPGLAGLPRWAWSRLPRAGRVAVALLPLVVLALALLLGPGIDRSKDERARSQAQLEQRARAERTAQLRAEQRPRFGRSAAVAAPSAPAAQRLQERGALVAEVEHRVLADARARANAGELRGPIDRVDCEPFPRTVHGVGAQDQLERRRGRYSCIAVTARIRGEGADELGVIGHPYRFMVDFETGDYAFCKISGRPGEGLLEREIPVTVPRPCGGR
jgi:hypothetical protein